MSIVTRTGDDGTTGLMYNRRVSKSDPRVEAYGTIDELNASMGMARALSTHGFVRDSILGLQLDLVTVMGELATLPEDLPRYQRDGFKVTGPDFIERVEAIIRRIESEGVSYKGWATPGATADSAALDVARTTCRRAERRLNGLAPSGAPASQNILVFLNRLSDLLWLLARWVETQHHGTASPS
jgi:cob(I)alamin adenosyltransferase